MPIFENILLPTAYFPPISYFVYLTRSREACIEQMETFPKQTYRNRCEIMTASGKAKLIVPITKPQGNHTLTRDIGICYREPWREQHWKTLQSAYSSSPFFTYYTDTLQPLFESEDIILINHNSSILQTITGLIGIQPTIKFTDDFEKQPETKLDLRSGLSSKKSPFQLEFSPYPQVFSHKYGFIPNLSILDVLFNLGPEAGRYLEKLTVDN